MLQGLIQIALTLIIVVAIAPVFGNYMAQVYMGEPTILDPAIKPVEKFIYTASNIRSSDSMTGWQYARSLLYSNIAMGIFVFIIFILQGWTAFKCYLARCTNLGYRPAHYYFIPHKYRPTTLLRRDNIYLSIPVNSGFFNVYLSRHG